MKRTNIMLTDEQHSKLKIFARKKGATLGELVRNALDDAYKGKDSLDRRKTIAIKAYSEGFISIGKLSEVLGVDLITARLYLKDKNISIKGQESQEIKRDAMNA
jgi:predicted HTH domain antitoxin